MDLSDVVRSARPHVGGVRKLGVVPRQIVTPARDDLARELAREIRDIARETAFCATAQDFMQQLHDRLEPFIILSLALTVKTSPSNEPPPHLEIGPRLGDVLGEGADAEFDFCEYTLWSAVRRASTEGMKLNYDSPHQEPRVMSFFSEAMLAVFLWTILGEGADAPGAQPAALSTALRFFRDTVLAVNEAATAIAGEDEAPELNLAAFDAEGAFLAMDADA